MGNHMFHMTEPFTVPWQKCRQTERCHCSKWRKYSYRKTGSAAPHVGTAYRNKLYYLKIQKKKINFLKAMSEPQVYLNGKKEGAYGHSYSILMFPIYKRRWEHISKKYLIKNLLLVGILVLVYIESKLLKITKASTNGDSL
jgi:hypothetical protein